MKNEVFYVETEEKVLLAQELARTMVRFRRIGWQDKSKHGIRMSEYMLLCTLKECNASKIKGIKVSDLSTRMRITPAAVTHMINSLEEAGYIERLPDSTDRRVVLVCPTEKSLGVMEKMQAEHLEFLQDWVAFLGEQDSKELIRLLKTSFDYVKERRDKSGKDYKK